MESIDSNLLIRFPMTEPLRFVTDAKLCNSNSRFGYVIVKEHNSTLFLFFTLSQSIRETIFYKILHIHVLFTDKKHMIKN